MSLEAIRVWACKNAPSDEAVGELGTLVEQYRVEAIAAFARGLTEGETGVRGQGDACVSCSKLLIRESRPGYVCQCIADCPIRKAANLTRESNDR